MFSSIPTEKSNDPSNVVVSKVTDGGYARDDNTRKLAARSM
jgi:hypothetical protein